MILLKKSRVHDLGRMMVRRNLKESKAKPVLYQVVKPFFDLIDLIIFEKFSA